MDSPATPAANTTHKYRWRLFLAVEGVLLVSVIAGSWAVFTVPGISQWMAVALTVMWVWLICTLPICVLHMLGRPVAFNLSPLVPSFESREYHRELRRRAAMSDDEFYGRFYAESGIPPGIPTAVRHCLSRYYPLAVRAVPSDNLALLDDELDLAEILRWVGNKLGLRFTRADYPAFDGTVDSLIRLTHEKITQKTSD